MLGNYHSAILSGAATMAEKILVACAGTAGDNVAKTLRAAGHRVQQVSATGAARERLRDMPDLLLIDAELLGQSSSENRQAFAYDLQLAEIPCLRFSSNGMDCETMRALTPWAAATIIDPRNAGHVLEQVELLLKMTLLAAGKNLAEERLIARQFEIEQGLSSASHIQRSLLPSVRPQAETFSFAWQFLPCETVGGDLFNLVNLSEDTLMAYLIDVSGHGVSSAMVTVSVYQSLAAHTGRLVKRLLDQPPYFLIPSPAEVLTGLDREYPYERFEKFFTIVYLLLEPATGKVRYCNGGHPLPIVVRADGTLELLREGGTLIGMGGLVPYEEGEIQMLPGDRLYIYSDGVTEYFSEAGDLFGEQRLFDFLLIDRNLSVDRVIENLMASLREFGGGRAPDDDVSILGIEFTG
jgi:sigma-B regulation protein RsbU (phosphoserine phosphatase)